MNIGSAGNHIIWFQRSEISFNRESVADKGGSCIVHVGTHARHGKVALKRLGKWGEVQKEVAIWRELRHVNVLAFLGVLGEGDYMHLVSPWVENGSLCAYLSGNPEANRIKLLKDVAEGLAYLHDNQVVHGDLKGLNVLISRNARSMLCDFGLSKHMENPSAETRDAVGTLRWMAPERMLGGGPGRSFEDDVYAFGMVIYEALSGQIPFFHYLTFSQIIKAVCDRRERPNQTPAASASGQPYGAIWMMASACWVHEARDRPSMPLLLHQECFSSIEIESGGDEVHRKGARTSAIGDNPPWGPTQHGSLGRARKRSRSQAMPGEGPNYKLPRVDPSWDMNNEHLREILKPVITANFEAKRQVPVETCADGTRTQLLRDILEWAWSDNPESSVFLINGMAGFGKSTIAKTVAARSELHGRLGATFFFSRCEGAGLRTADAVVPTIAYQLAQRYPSFRAELIAQSRVDDPADWVSIPLDVQFKRLDTALRSSASFPCTPLIILDAFDECEWTGSRALLSILLNMAFPTSSSNPFPLKFLITSRPEIDLISIFRRYLQRKEYILHEMDDSLARNDIRLYLEQSLMRIPTILNMDKLPPRWFLESDLDKLTDAAGLFFIYAATAIRIIEDARVRNPKAQLRSLLAPKGSSSVRYPALDALYLSILLPTTTCTNPEFALDQYQSVIGALAFLRDRLSIAALGDLLDMQSEDVVSALLPLRSIIIVPPDTAQPSTIYHASFIDYVTSGRCIEERLRLVPWDRERHLAICCLRVMNHGLKQNIGEIPDPTIDIANIPDLEDRVSPELRYAALYWASHLTRAPPGDVELIDLIGDFASRCLIWWIEISSVLKRLDSAVTSCQDAVMWLGQSSSTGIVASLISDGSRLVLAHGCTLISNPLQLYTSVLAFIPRDIPLSRIQANGKQTSRLMVRIGRDSQWPGHLAMWTGHTDAVNSVSFSPDGAQVVSGSDDLTVHIWDVASGSCSAILDGHEGWVTSVAFSPNGTEIACGSKDKAVWVWDAVSGRRTSLLKAHEGTIRSVAFSPSGTRAISGSDDKTVRIWDVMSGRCTSVLEGHDDCVNSAAISPDGTLAVSGSDDQHVRIWDVASEICTFILEGHTACVMSVVFYPNGTRLASASGDQTVRLWDVVSGCCISVLEGHDSWVNSVTVSLDGAQLATGSGDKTVRFWDAGSGRCKSVLEGHDDWINSVAFSPDGTRVISGSADRTVRIWDVAAESTRSVLEGHSDRVNSVAFSPDGTLAVSGSDDHEVRIWDVARGSCQSVLEGHIAYVRSVVFSSAGTQVASGSDDTTVRVWGVGSASCISLLEGHTSTVISVAFSRNGIQLVSGSSDKIVRIWDVVSGSCTSILRGHEMDVTSVAFSPDATQVVSGSKNVRVWDVESGICTSILEGHTNWIDSVTFSLDGTRITSRSFVETLEWQIDPDDPSNGYESTTPVPNLLLTVVQLTPMRDRWLGFLDVEGMPKRICRLPPRIAVGSPMAFHDALFLAGSDDGVVTVLDVSALLPSDMVT